MDDDMRPHIESTQARVLASGMSMSKFLAQCGVSRSTWWRWREGKGRPNMATWDRVQVAAHKLPWGKGTTR